MDKSCSKKRAAVSAGSLHSNGALAPFAQDFQPLKRAMRSQARSTLHKRRNLDVELVGH